MKFVYQIPQNKNSDTTELHIKKALEELGHEVVPDGDGDIYLFHKEYHKPANFKGKVVCWYFDKIWKHRLEWYEVVKPMVDYFYMTDGDWVFDHPGIEVLRQGIGDITPGVYEERPVDIAFTGNIYGGREDFFVGLAERYGKRFKIYERQFNRNLNNICASIPIFVAPKFPSTDRYWSNRVYLITGSGGFLIHPKLYYLKKEWGDNLVYYDDMPDLYKKIDYYLANPEEREKMRQKEHNYCVKNFTYKHRVKELCQSLSIKLASGRKG